MILFNGFNQNIEKPVLWGFGEAGLVEKAILVVGTTETKTQKIRKNPPLKGKKHVNLTLF